MTTYERSCLFLVDRISFSRWSGPYHRGHARCVKDAKRAEAEDRNHGRSGPSKPVDASSAAPCTHPHKTAYPNRDAVMAAFYGMPKWRRRQSLNPYHCPAGHWHLGRRIVRATTAWRNN